MEIEPKRVPFSAEEKLAIENLVTKYKLDVVTDRRADGASPTHKKKAWMELTLEYNAVPERRKRSVDQLKKCWDNMKTRKKKELFLKKHTHNGMATIKDEEVYSALTCVETLIDGEAAEPPEDSSSYQQIRYANGNGDTSVAPARPSHVDGAPSTALRVKSTGQPVSGSVTTNSSGFDEESPTTNGRGGFDTRYQSLLVAEQELKIMIAREELRIKRLERVRLQEELEYVRACRSHTQQNGSETM